VAPYRVPVQSLVRQLKKNDNIAAHDAAAVATAHDAAARARPAPGARRIGSRRSPGV
jgi:hypothetical protein